MTHTVDPDLLHDLTNLLDKIDNNKNKIYSALMCSGTVFNIHAYSVEIISREIQSPKHVNITKLKVDALHRAASNFKVQTVQHNGPTVPERIMGTIEISPSHSDMISHLVTDHNRQIDDLKTWLTKNIGNTRLRSLYLHSAKPHLIIASLYRKIKIAPVSTYRISYSWNSSQKAPIRVSLDDIERIILEQGDLLDDNERVIKKAQDLAKDEINTLSSLPRGYEYVILKDIKVHPQQSIYHRTANANRVPYKGSERTFRDTVKANNCLLILMNASATSAIKYREPHPFVKKDNKSITAHYQIIREHLNLYIRPIPSNS